METIYLVIIAVFGVLQIILFFKIWGMTNDVRKLTNKFCPKEAPAPLPKITHEIQADDAPLAVGDIVERCSDGKEMVVDRIVGGRYGCADVNTNVFISGYNRNQLRFKYRKTSEK